MNPQLYLDLVRAELSGIYGYALSQELDEIIRTWMENSGRSNARRPCLRTASHSAAGIHEPV